MAYFRSHWQLGGLTALLVLAAMVTIGCAAPGEQSGEASTPYVSSGGEANPPVSLTRLDNGEGGVTVEATWITPAHLQEMGKVSTGGFTPEQYVLVHVKLDTHSVDLSRYNMTRLATLSGLDDTASMPAAGWVGIQEDSHHREGYLAFPGGSNGQWEAKEKIAELRLKDVGGVAERVFHWEF
ncbi:MAG: hypothetical protein Q7K03_05660 [Dehalococcoidia bacterium]|nr:hypothetical protein [Dehalococcoidia bacterium]